MAWQLNGSAATPEQLAEMRTSLGAVSKSGDTLDEGASLAMYNGSKIKAGDSTIDRGGNGGIALECYAGYDLQWEAGRLYTKQTGTDLIQRVDYQWAPPTGFDDEAQGYYPGSRWVTRDNEHYVCEEATASFAVWKRVTYGSGSTASGNNAFALGYNNTASGNSSSAFGCESTASGNYSSAIGYGNNAIGDGSSAFGRNNTASGAYDASAIGHGNVAGGNLASAVGCNNTVNGQRAAAFGYGNAASGDGSSAFGYGSTASDYNASALGYNNTASNHYSSAFGSFNNSSGDRSSTVGHQNIATAAHSLACGTASLAGQFARRAVVADSSHIEISNCLVEDLQDNDENLVSSLFVAFVTNDGVIRFGSLEVVGATQNFEDVMVEVLFIPQDWDIRAVINLAKTNTAKNMTSTGVLNVVGGNGSSAFGYGNITTGNNSSAFGRNNITNVNSSVAIGFNNTASAYYSNSSPVCAIGVGNRTEANGGGVAIGHNNIAGSFSSAIGIGNTASDYNSSAIGYGNVVSSGGTAFGYLNQAQNNGVALGRSNTTSGYNCVVVGYSNTANGNNGIAFGRSNSASGYYSSAFGYGNTASGSHSSAFGFSNIASGNNSSAFGCRAKTAVQDTLEIGYWIDPTTRSGAVRMHSTGMVASTIQPRSTPYTDGGALAGSEADNTLPRDMYAIRRNGTALLVDLNIGGAIHTTALGGPVPVDLLLSITGEDTNLTTGANKLTFRMPHAMTLTSVRASVKTAPVGSTVVVDINRNGSTILSTKLSIDANEKTSTTAATAPVISIASLADDAEITIDIDQIGSSTPGAGLKVLLKGTRA